MAKRRNTLPDRVAPVQISNQQLHVHASPAADRPGQLLFFLKKKKEKKSPDSQTLTGEIKTPSCARHLAANHKASSGRGDGRQPEVRVLLGSRVSLGSLHMHTYMHFKIKTRFFLGGAVSEEKKLLGEIWMMLDKYSEYSVLYL